MDRMHIPDADRGGRARRPETAAAAAALLLALALLFPAGPVTVPARAQSRSEFVPTFSTNNRVKQQVERLHRLAAQKMWDEWLAQYQQLVNDPRDLLLARDTEFFVGIRWHCHQLLAGLPAAVRQRYRALYDAEARRLYERAAAERDESQMRDLYSRFRFSSYADRALLWIANRALDEGRSELARVAYARLARDPGVSAVTLLRYAMAAGAARRPAEGRAVLERVRREFGVQPLQLGGRHTTAAAAADELSRTMRDAGPAPGWTSFTGESQDRKMAGLAAGELKRAWEFTHPSSADAPRTTVGGQIVIIGRAYSSSASSRFGFSSFPIAGNDRIWVQGPRNLSAVKLETGEPLWTQREFALSPDEYPVVNTNPRLGGSLYRSYRPIQAAPSVDGRMLVARVPMAAGESSGSRWPADFAICGIDSRTGSILWRRIVGGEPRGEFFNIPTIQANMVFTGQATNKGGITEYSAVALDAGTGEPLWTTYLGAGSDPLYMADGSPAAVRDGLVWIESSLYTLNALDIITGEVRLVYRYEPGRRSSQRGGFDSSPTITNEPISAVAFGPRVAIDGREVAPVIFAPRWGIDVIALDPEGGRLLWSSPKAPGESRSGALFGVDRKHAYICGDHVQAVNLADGSGEWSWAPQSPSSGIGFAVLSGDRIYLPVEGKIHVRSALDGREMQVLDVTDAVGDSSGFATLVSVRDMLLFTTRDRVVAFTVARQ